MKRYILAVFCLLFAAAGHAQTFLQSTTSVNSCTGTYFDSGGSAGNYVNNEFSTFTICSNASNCVSVTFTSFSLESGFDFLEIYDGPNTGSPLIGSFTGTTSPGTVTSTTGCLTFVFSSDISVTSTGWSATVSCGACPPPPPCLPNMSNCSTSVCSGNFFDSGGSAGSYNNNENFTTTICSSTPGQCVSVNFTSFNTESGFDELEIFDGSSTAAPLIGVFSGTTSPGTVTSTTGCLTFRFTSDGSITSAGWTASISCTSCPPPPSCLPNMSNCSTSVCTGDFFDSGGSGGAYNNNENFTTTICSSTPGQCVSVNFTSFSTESGLDELEIYDGASTAAPLIGVFSGSTSPGTVTSTTGCLTFRFTSDFSITSTGWTSTISCAPCVVPPSGCTGVPDSCLIACNLGSLPNHLTCNGSPTEGQGTPVTFGGLTNVGAVPQNPYTSIIGCQGVGDMSAPANDVWYRFVLNSPSVNVEIFNSTLDSVSVGIWEFTGSCANLIPQGCATSANGNLTATFDLLTPGNTYYLQVSGGATAPNTGNFDLRLTGFEDCSQCIRAASLTVNPPPVNGEYPPGTCVTFTFNITDWNFTLANWLHGVIPTFGVGWNLATLSLTPPASCDLSGNWAWYNSCTSTATSQTFGPGFYYDSNAGGPLDGNPGNNFGDFCSCCWTFSWTVCTSPTCVPGEDLSVTINTTGDGESGSWSSLSCTSDPIFFSATATCALPVEWLSFTGRTETEGNRLFWSTASESNADFYLVERSLDGENWSQAGQQSAQGTTAQQSDYEFLDRFPYGEKIYYRLRQFDFNGNSGESEVIELSRTSGWQTGIGNVYPNPVKDQLQLDLTFRDAGTYQLMVSDLLGKVLLEKSFEANQGYVEYSIKVDDLAAGTYLLTLRDREGKQVTEKFVKE